MLILLSPAKTIDTRQAQLVKPRSAPLYIKQTLELVNQLKKLSLKELQDLFKVNPKLAQLNYERYQFWIKDVNQWDRITALLSFKGEVFRGLEAWSLQEDALVFSQDHLRILSGLYGVLRPLDVMQPYRLEIGTSLPNRKGKNLYDFWKTTITRQIKNDLSEQETPTIINLASKEYSHAVDFKKLKVPVYECQFLDYKDGKYKFLTVYGKHARGKMARFILEHQLTNPDDLKAFDEDGYIFNPDLSQEYNLVYTRG